MLGLGRNTSHVFFLASSDVHHQHREGQKCSGMNAVLAFNLLFLCYSTNSKAENLFTAYRCLSFLSAQVLYCCIESHITKKKKKIHCISFHYITFPESSGPLCYFTPLSIPLSTITGLSEVCTQNLG